MIGAQKAGTTALYAYLRWHPAITGPSWKEVSFFDRHWWRGEAWYRGQFPLRAEGKLVGEASPSYLFHPLAPERVDSLVPGREARRAPPRPRSTGPTRSTSTRSRSAASRCRSRTRSRPRTSALRGEVERLRRRSAGVQPCVVGPHVRGARALRASSSSAGSRSSRASSCSSSRPRSSARGPAETYASILAFLGAPPHALDAYPRVFDRDYAPMRAADACTRSTARFAEPNRRLEALLGRPLGWPAP